MKKPKLLDYLLLVILALIWASAFFNIKIATYSFGPVTIAFLRVFFGAIPVLLLCYYKDIKIEAFSKDWHWFAMIGFINFVAPFFLIAYGVQSVQSNLAAILMSTTPLSSTVLGHLMHHGIDLAGTWQENISVSADGIVVFAGYHGSFGKVVRIKHNYGIMTTYGHLAKISVRSGDIVNEGQVIGKMGRTGKVKGAHLHYEISVNGKSQNPATYIKIGRSLLSRTSLKGYVIKN